MRPYELWIGLRYTRAKRRNHFISFISGVSMAGIALGVMALIVVLSVMNGFQDELRSRILGVASHMEISGPDGRLADWPALAEQVRKHPDVRGYAPYVAGQGLLVMGDSTKGAMIRGILPEQEAQVTDIGAHMRIGTLAELKAHEFNIVLGADLANALGVTVGDKVTVIVPQGVVTPAGLLPRMKQFRVVGLFSVGMFEYDAGLALMHIDDAARLYRLGDAVSGLRLKLADMDRAPWVTRELAHTLVGDYYLSDWTMSHANFFRAVAIEKRMMFIILLLIVAVAAFNIVSTLVMAVTDKQPDIAILRTLGASPASIMKVFMVQGSLIGVIGTLAGVVLGVLLALNVETVVPLLERALHMDLFPADVYYISELPSKVIWSDVGTIAGVSLTLAFLATLYPSWRAARVQPAEALRYE
ncbi:lipoprotein-releasing ABC transporter permease subunit [Parasulfuritortus cantonensis]|uniref:Lipoprotein-releasing ABC transporter permease subunit n=1 Tax=Parasulfuritortus cantonensis TaxID=2528202 RepID=A0A4R1B192_9PROT|nr:lipoprotein-releasing ABC transporter permease subunit [Parasulfuritortus cantonensis]TCJ11782.1 lipoprotein-releasing ABC transporter permease subunit [Parasulfuritortus cantonensis]